jgi:hypothetical protein
MTSMKNVARVLGISAAAALLGAACSSSEDLGEPEERATVTAGGENAQAQAGDERIGTDESAQYWTRRPPPRLPLPPRPLPGRGRGGRRWGAWGGGGSGGSGGTLSACGNLPNGTYCGGNMVPGSPGTLYQCWAGQQYLAQQCANGCSQQPAGVADYCY